MGLYMKQARRFDTNPTTSPPPHHFILRSPWPALLAVHSLIGRKMITIMFSNITTGLCWRQDAYFVF